MTVPLVASVWTTYCLDRDEHCSRVQREAIAAGEKGLAPDVATLGRLERPSGVVSTNQQPTLEFAFDRLDAPAFDVVQGRPPTVESLRRKEPDPHYLERALAAVGAASALYVGDSPHDVVAAHEAGIDAAFLRREHDADLSPPEPVEYELGGLSEPAIRPELTVDWR